MTEQFNEQLLERAQSAIAQCKVEQLSEDDTFHMAVGSLIRYGRSTGVIGEDVDAAMQSAIELVVREAMNSEPTMVRCPYCRQMHYTEQVSKCPLRS